MSPVKGKILIFCPKCGLDRGKEVGGLGDPCPKCGFKPKLIKRMVVVEK